MKGALVQIVAHIDDVEKIRAGLERLRLDGFVRVTTSPFLEPGELLVWKKDEVEGLIGAGWPTSQVSAIGYAAEAARKATA